MHDIFHDVTEPQAAKSHAQGGPFERRRLRTALVPRAGGSGLTSAWSRVTANAVACSRCLQVACKSSRLVLKLAAFLTVPATLRSLCSSVPCVRLRSLCSCVFLVFLCVPWLTKIVTQGLQNEASSSQNARFACQGFNQPADCGAYCFNYVVWHPEIIQPAADRGPAAGAKP
jgi:hypothetical protein